MLLTVFWVSTRTLYKHNKSCLNGLLEGSSPNTRRPGRELSLRMLLSLWDSGCCVGPLCRWLPACTCHNRVTASAPLTQRFCLPERFNGETRSPEQILNVLFALDKEGCSLCESKRALLSVWSRENCKVQPCKGAPATFRWRGDILYLSAFKRTCLAVCWQRQSSPFLCRTSLQMFTGAKHKRHLSVICWWSLKMCKSLIKFTVMGGQMGPCGHMISLQTPLILVYRCFVEINSLEKTFIIDKQAVAVGVDFFNTEIDDIRKSKANFNLKCEN